MGKPKGKGKAGAPRLYDREAITQAICERLATGEPMALICRDLGVPVRTVNQWRQDDEAIANRFDEARDLGYDAIAHDALLIADTPRLGVIEKIELIKDQNGHSKMVVTERRKEDMLGHRKLQVETRLRLLARWDPRRYGDRLALANDPKDPLLSPPTQLTEAQLLAIAAQGIREQGDADGGTDG